MNNDRENLNDRYLDATLREELGPRVDLTQRVLHATSGGESQRHRVMPLPRRAPIWQPLAAAAAVLIAAGLGVFALVQVLPQNQPNRYSATTPSNDALPLPRPLPAPDKQPEPAPQPKANTPETDDTWPPLPLPEPEPKLPKEVKVPKGELPLPEPKLPEGEIKKEPEPDYPEGWTDPPESWPGRIPEGTQPKQRTALCAEIKPSRKDAVRIADNGKWKVMAAGQAILDGDRIKVSGWADLVLADGGLVRLDGEMTFTLEDKSTVLGLVDGALFADCKSPVTVAHESVRVVIDGQAVVEQRVRSLDVAVLQGTAVAGQSSLAAGRTARLEVEGFGRDKPISFADLQREHRFLKDKPERKAMREDFTSYSGEIWSGEVRDGILKGGNDPDRGLAFHFEDLKLRGNELVRLRYRVSKRCDLVLQFGATGNGNYRHVIRGVEAGKWLEAEVPVNVFFTKMDESQKLTGGQVVRRFQMHDDDGIAIEVEIDWLEILSRP